MANTLNVFLLIRSHRDDHATSVGEDACWMERDSGLVRRAVFPKPMVVGSAPMTWWEPSISQGALETETATDEESDMLLHGGMRPIIRFEPLLYFLSLVERDTILVQVVLWCVRTNVEVFAYNLLAGEAQKIADKLRRGPRLAIGQ